MAWSCGRHRINLYPVGCVDPDRLHDDVALDDHRVLVLERAAVFRRLAAAVLGRVGDGDGVFVDVETGVVKVERIVAVHDCGRPINPLGVKNQINGGIIQGISYALYENRILDKNEGVAQRATFLVDPQGIIRFVYVTDLNVGRSPEEVLRVLDFTLEILRTLPLELQRSLGVPPRPPRGRRARRRGTCTRGRGFAHGAG